MWVNNAMENIFDMLDLKKLDELFGLIFDFFFFSQRVNQFRFS